MDGLTGADDSRLNFRWGRMASCLRQLLTPEFSAAEIAELERQVIPTNDRFQGSELLPLTQFSSENQANALWERVALTLIESGVGPPEVRTDVDGIFEELALNAAQHSRSPGNYAILEVDGAQRRRTMRQTGGEVVYVLGLSDAGIGIPTSLRENPLYAGIAEDKDAILRATELDVTGTAEPRGAGLYHVMERVRTYQGELMIISGDGLLTVESGGEPVTRDISASGDMYRHGTTVLLALPFPA